MPCTNVKTTNNPRGQLGAACRPALDRHGPMSRRTYLERPARTREPRTIKRIGREQLNRRNRTILRHRPARPVATPTDGHARNALRCALSRGDATPQLISGAEQSSWERRGAAQQPSHVTNRDVTEEQSRRTIQKNNPARSTPWARPEKEQSQSLANR